MVGTGRGAQLGILIRGPEVLEQTRRVTTIVLDKTGTRHRGADAGRAGRLLRPASTAPELIRLAASAEAASEHPIAQAIVAHAREHGVEADPVERFESRSGLGVEAVVDGHTVVVGRPSMLAETGLGLDAELAETVAREEAGGRTVVAAAIDGSVAGLFALADRIKPTSAAAVADATRARADAGAADRRQRARREGGRRRGSASST